MIYEVTRVSFFDESLGSTIFLLQLKVNFNCLHVKIGCSRQSLQKKITESFTKQ